MIDFNEIKNIFRGFKTVDFEAKSFYGSKMNWDILGNGFVSVFYQNERFIFDEKIKLQNNINCEDQKHWIFQNNEIILQRKNKGKLETIFSFIPTKNGMFLAKNIFHCEPDFYQGFLKINHYKSILVIRIIGTKKNELLRYVYK